MFWNKKEVTKLPLLIASSSSFSHKQTDCFSSDLFTSSSLWNVWGQTRSSKKNVLGVTSRQRRLHWLRLLTITRVKAEVNPTDHLVKRLFPACFVGMRRFAQTATGCNVAREERGTKHFWKDAGRKLKRLRQSRRDECSANFVACVTSTVVGRQMCGWCHMERG